MRDSTTRASFFTWGCGKELFLHNSTCLFVLAPSLSENPLPIFAFSSRTKAKAKKKKGDCEMEHNRPMFHWRTQWSITGLTLHSAFSFWKGPEVWFCWAQVRSTQRIPWQLRMPPGGCAPVQLWCFWLRRHMQLLWGIMKCLFISVCVWKKFPIK